MAQSSVIGRGTSIRGHVRGDGDLEVHGRVEGDVSVSGDLALSDSAVVRGNLTGAELRVAGTVQGDLRGSEAVFLEATARVVGDISAPRIGIASGALVKGLVQTDGEAPLAGAQPALRRAVVVNPAQTSRAAPQVYSTRSAPAASRAPVAPARTTRNEPRAVPPVIERPHVEPARAPERAEPAEDTSKKEQRSAAPPPVVPALAKQTRATRRGNKRGS